MAGVPGLDGEGRQAVAERLWRAWRDEGRPASVLTGFSGTGKTDRVVAPLVARARDEQTVAIHIDVPAQPTDLEGELLARIKQALQDRAAKNLAEEMAAASSLAIGLRPILDKGGLVVIDEFQRLLQPRSFMPIDPFADQLAGLARRPADGGCLWLVSNRSVDAVWAEPFHSALLEAPREIQDAVRIILESLGTEDAKDRLPASRHEEIAGRFGHNPRALRLLGQLLRFYEIEELMGPPRAVPQGLSQEDLANDIERSLLARAREGLSNAASELLRELAILPEPAPMELLQAVGGHLGGVGTLLMELQQRFLVEQRRGLRQVHPVVREVELPRLARDGEPYRAANRRAGQWYAARLAAAARTFDDETSFSRDLAGARYHLLTAGAHGEMRAALDGIQPYIERRFSWTARLPLSAADRDAQISLLELFLETRSVPSVEYNLSRFLQMRGEGDDLTRALAHAERASVGQDFHDPWVLRLQLAYLVKGSEAAVALGREAIEAVDPAKSLSGVYQVLAAVLANAGQDDEAVEMYLEGAERSLSNEPRLIDRALALAATMPTNDNLHRVQDWARKREALGPVLALADVLLDERAGDWRGGAERARLARRQYPTYLHLALHEAFCWLGADAPDEAQRALDVFPRNLRLQTRRSATWLAAFIAVRRGETAQARELTATCADGPVPASPVGIEGVLLREWDSRVPIFRPHPAREFPILPPSLSGLTAPVMRPQHGPPVLPQHSERAKQAEAARSGRLRVLAIGTEWSSGQGGLSTFNRQLCCALADAGLDVACIVINPSAAEIGRAGESGVRLVPARVTTGVNEREWLARRPTELGEDYAPDFIIGHGRITGPAALRLAEDSFRNARRLHFVHMAPDEIEWHKLDREAMAGIRAEDRTRQELELGRSAYRVVAVGPRLHDRYTRDLYPAPNPIRFDPGFDGAEDEPRGPPPGAPWKVLLLGRAEDYRLKGVDLAAGALGRVVQLRDRGLPAIEFVVRGARPEDVDKLRDDVLRWANSPRLQVVIRPYTAEEANLDHDMRTSSLVLMPSRREGFGLVGLEAIVLGTPVLVSSSSGLAQLLKEALDAEQAARVVVETTGDEIRTSADIDEWQRAIEATLRDREAAFRRAAELREMLRIRHTWRTSVMSLLSELSRQPDARST